MKSQFGSGEGIFTCTNNFQEGWDVEDIVLREIVILYNWLEDSILKLLNWNFEKQRWFIDSDKLKVISIE